MAGVGGQRNSAQGYKPGVDYCWEDSEEEEGSLLYRMTGPNCPASLTQAEGLVVEVL